MVERRRGARLVQQPAPDLGVEVTLHHFDRDIAAEREVVGAVDRAHPAAPQQGVEPIAFRERRADHGATESSRRSGPCVVAPAPSGNRGRMGITGRGVAEASLAPALNPSRRSWPRSHRWLERWLPATTTGRPCPGRAAPLPPPAAAPPRNGLRASAQVPPDRSSADSARRRWPAPTLRRTRRSDPD